MIFSDNTCLLEKTTKTEAHANRSLSKERSINSLYNSTHAHFVWHDMHVSIPSESFQETRCCTRKQLTVLLSEKVAHERN